MESGPPPPRALRCNLPSRWVGPALLACCLSCAAPTLAADAPDERDPDPTVMSLDELLEIGVIGASRYEQKQSEVAAAVSVITRREIQAFGWRTLSEALGSLPGVHLTYDRQYTYIGARGFGLPGDLTARVLVMIDGVRINDPTYDGGPIGREAPVDLDAVERIEFIPGPGGAVYGHNAMFAVVNVITRRGSDYNGIELSGAYEHEPGTREARVSWGQRFTDGTDAMVTLYGMHSDGSDRHYSYGASGIAGKASGLDGEAASKLLARVGNTGWSVELIHGDRRKEDPTGSFLSDPLARDQYTRDRYSVVSAEWDRALFDDTLHLGANAFLGRYRFDSALQFGDRFTFPGGSDWRGAAAHVVYTGFADHKLLVGLEAQETARNEQNARSQADPSANVRIQRTGYRRGAYAQDEWTLAPALTMTVGLRVDDNDVIGTKTSPRVAFNLAVSPDLGVKLLYGRAHRAPNAYEHDYADGVSVIDNPSLGAESIDTIEAVFDYRLQHDLALRTSVYRWATRDLIVLGVDAASGLAQYTAGDNLRARGIELSADKTWEQGARLRGSLSLQDAGGGDRLVNSPRFLARMNLSSPLPWAGMHLGMEMRYDGDRRAHDGTCVDGALLADAFIGTDALADGVSVSLRVTNLFDEHYLQPASDLNWQTALEQDGRSVRLQIGFRR